MPGLSPAGAGPAEQGRGPRGRLGPGRLYRRQTGSSPRLRRAVRPALLSPAPPDAPAFPPLPPRPPPPPPNPPRNLIDESLKKSPRSRAASAGELRHSRNPRTARTAQRPRAHGCRTPGAAHPPAPRAPARGDPRDREGRGRPRTLLPSPEERKHTNKESSSGERKNAPVSNTFFRRRGGWVDGSLTQVR